MKTDIQIPTLPESNSEAKIVHFYVNEGQEVEYNQALFDVETDKVVLEIVSPSKGIIKNIQLSEGEFVSPEQLVMSLHERADSDSPIEPKKVKPIETTIEKRVKDDSESIALEQVVGNSLFDKRSMICGMFGLVVGILIGAIGAIIVLG